MYRTEIIVLALMVCFITYTNSVSAESAYAEITGDEWISKWWSWPTVWECQWSRDLQARLVLGAVTEDSKFAALMLLKQSMNSKSPELRRAVVQAMGKIADPLVVVELERCAFEDPEPIVCAEAYLALGKINRADVIERIAANYPQKGRWGWVAGLGVAKCSDKVREEALFNALKSESSPDILALIIWALRQVSPQKAVIASRMILQRSENMVLVNEAIQTLGKYGSDDDLRTLMDLYQISWRNTNSNSPAFNLWLKITKAGYLKGTIADFHTTPYINALRNSAAIAIGQKNLRRVPVQWEWISEKLQRSYSEIEISLDALNTHKNGNSVIVPPIFVNGEQQNKFQRIVLYLEDNTWRFQESFVDYEGVCNGNYPLRFGTLAAGMSGIDESGSFLLDFIRLKYIKNPKLRKYESHPQNPGRGFAAIALGRWLKKQTENKIDSASRDLRREALRWLASYAQDRNEPYNFRASCVLALGLSGDNEQISAIKKAVDLRKGKELFVAAYAALSLAMLGDKESKPLAEYILKNTPTADIAWENTGDATEKIADKDLFLQLVRRPAYLSLTISGGEQSKEILINSKLHTLYDLDRLRMLRIAGCYKEVFASLCEEDKNANEIQEVLNKSADGLVKKLTVSQMKWLTGKKNIKNSGSITIIQTVGV